MIAWGVFAVGGTIYFFAKGGDPEIKKFSDDCNHAGAMRYYPGAPDVEQIAFDCALATRRFMETR
jgi:hypothetical protein